MKKITIVINGQGGVGKDSFCAAISKHFRTQNISSITPAKQMAKIIGWKPTDKSDTARKMLSDLKSLMIEYNDYPTAYVLKMQNKFIKSDDQVLFIHIREREEIQKFLQKTKYETKTLLILGHDEYNRKTFGNKSDDKVFDFDYDYIYKNDKTLDELENDAVAFFKQML